jgi:hypothetical protein
MLCSHVAAGASSGAWNDPWLSVFIRGLLFVLSVFISVHLRLNVFSAAKQG